MWAIDNRTPFKVGKTWGRDKNGYHEWIVCVKATFDILADGHLEVADDQLDPVHLPEYKGEPGVSSLRYDTDLHPMKPTTDIVLNGTAYAPSGRPSTDFRVSMTIGSVSKVLRVKGDRVWLKGAMGPVSSAIEPVTQVPITYERAYGGYDRVSPDPADQRIDLRNPVGCGVVATDSHRVGQALPNFEYPDRSIDTAGPAGFGPIDSFWSPRREFSGTYDDQWRQHRLPLLPIDWDPRSLLCGPFDQLPDSYLRGGELVELINLTPDGRLRFVVPRLHFSFSTLFDGRTEEHRGRLSALILEPDERRVLMVWTTTLLCRTEGDYLERTIVRQKRFVE